MNYLMASATTTQAEAVTGGSPFTAFLPLIIIFVIFWVVLILPQRKQQKKRDAMLSALKKGDKVITIGGMHGEIIQIDDDEIRLRVADKVELRMLRSAVSRVKGE